MPLGEFSQTLVLYALHTHIFDWRTAVSMLNPTGLTGAPGHHSHGMGQGLRDRRKWLIDAFDSFKECYMASTAPAVSLLCHLGYVSLDVSISDMHLMTGRSSSIQDGSFAEENLKCWANSDIANSTMRHISHMLGICHRCLADGTATKSSFEITLCLFTGGLVCWAYAKLRKNVPKAEYIEQVRNASVGLRGIGCWRMSEMFGKILNEMISERK